MRLMATCLAVVLAILAVTTLVSATDKASDRPAVAAANSATAPATTQAANGAPVNKYCAVQGSPNKVDPTVFVIYKGQKIGFCCEDCIKDFNKDPDKYVASMK